MPRPRNTRTVREYEVPVDSMVPPDAVPLDPDAQRAAELEAQQIPDEEIDELFRVSDEMRTTAGVVLQIVRVLPVATAGFVGEMAPTEFTLERVRQQFGVGKYRVRVMGPKGYVPGGGSVTIAPVPEKPTPTHTGVEDVLAILRADKEASSAKLKDIGALLLTSPLVATIVSAWIAPKNQVTDLVQALAALQGLTPKPEKPPDFNSQLDNIAQLMSKLKELAGDDKTPTGSTWIDLIRDGINGVKPVLEQLATRALAGGPRPDVPVMMPSMQLPPPVPGPATVTVASPSPASSSGNAPSPNSGKAEPVGLVSLLPWLQATLQQLVSQAARNKDPALYAEVVFDNVPDGVDVKQLEPFLRRADWWTQLQQFAPQVTPYPAWFEDFRDALLDVITENTDPTPSPTPPPANNGGNEPQPMSELDPGEGM